MEKIDVGALRSFISNLSRVSSINLEIWEKDGPIFASKERSNDSPTYEEIQDLSKTVMDLGHFQYVLAREGYTIYGIPIQNGAGPVGALITHSSEKDNRGKGKPYPDSSGHKDMEDFLASIVSIMEERWIAQEEARQMAEEINQSYEELYLYSKIATQIKSLKYSETIQRDLVEDLLGVMRVDFAFAELPYHNEYNVMAIKPSCSEKIPDPDAFIKRLLDIVPQNNTSTNDDYFIINNSRQAPEFTKIHPDPYRFLAVKMKNNRQFYGWLGFVSFNMKEIFRQSELSLLVTMAEQIVVVMSNTELYHDLERFVINVVKSLVYAIEAKDEYTRGHSERVNSYCMMVAKRMGMDDEQKELLHWASILHDIGKIGIPESILNKPGRLTDEEYGFIKTHPQKGYEILEPIEQLKGSLEGILCHHERYDGKGYPRGLKGDEVPLIGRIIAVADTFDAITSDRAYRSAKSSSEALEILDQVAGTQLDAGIVDIFKTIVEESMNLKSEVRHAG